jgi:hypothetical protein
MERKGAFVAGTKLSVRLPYGELYAKSLRRSGEVALCNQSYSSDRACQRTTVVVSSTSAESCSVWVESAAALAARG